ncbi:MAG: cell wall biosynthesis glycosyltransferase [Candidatus Bathyarchaeota archaeon]|nr:cell wall biosynthesis glycosyltransferase [Candidatus Bathyarchaeota archaeon]
MSENSALSIDAKIYLHDIERADIIVGIPSFNNALTVSYVLSQAIKGLDKYFPNFKSVIFVSDGNSADNTLASVKQVNLPSAVKLIPALYMGLSGKGTAIKAIFEAARSLKARSVALIDSDLRSITPEWMQLLITPTLTGTGFVAPFYNRRKYDGTITNFLCYPITRSVFGKDIRQPIGGDFGLSIELVNDLLDSSLWKNDDISRFGIDIFETLTAIAKGYKIQQARLGIKSHDPKDPSSQLSSMFRQVINTMFSCIEQYESAWKDAEGVSKTEFVGEAQYAVAPEQIQVSLPATIDAFKNNFNVHMPIYESFLDKELVQKFEQLKHLETTMEVDFSSEVWAKTVYSFIAEYHKKPSYGHEKLIDALRILWIGRVAVFLKETWLQSRDEAEKHLAEEAAVFEALKPYLMEKYYSADASVSR